MPANYDATTKYLVETAPQDWLALCGHDVQGPVKVVDADLSTITTMADKVVRVEEPEPWMAHFEFQSSYDSSIGLRLLRYNVLIEYRHQLPVQSILILLKPESDGPAASGITRRSLPNGTCYYEFRFQSIRVWQLPLNELLTGKIGTLPLAPVSDVAQSNLSVVIRRMIDRVELEVPSENRNEFWTATGILMGTRYEFSIIDALLQGVSNMQDSSVIQEFLNRGRAEEAKRILQKTLERKFRVVHPQLQTYIDSVLDVSQLEELVCRVGEVTKWEELLP